MSESNAAVDLSAVVDEDGFFFGYKGGKVSEDAGKWLDKAYMEKLYEADHSKILDLYQGSFSGAKASAGTHASSSAYAQMETYEDGYNSPADFGEPLVEIKWYEKPEIFAKVVEVYVRVGAMNQKVSYTVSEQMLAEMTSPDQYGNTHYYNVQAKALAYRITDEIDYHIHLSHKDREFIRDRIQLVLMKGLTYYSNNGQPQPYIHNEDNFAGMSTQLPAMDQIVSHPAFLGNPNSYVGKLLKCPNHKSLTLRSMIIHLNDQHQWSREKIADWIDELHDSGIIDAEFHIEMEDDNERSS